MAIEVYPHCRFSKIWPSVSYYTHMPLIPAVTSHPWERVVSPNQDPYEVPTPKPWCIIHTYMAWIQSYYMNSWVTKEIHRQWSFRVLNIAEAKPKYYHSAIQGPASALRCEVLGCCSRGGLPSLFSLLELVTGSHPLATAVTKSWYLCTQLKYKSKIWATKAQQDWPVNMVINSRLLACKAEIG
jgi:hypothetical protein